MTTLGYGDVVPKNQNEKIFGSIMALISCVIFAFISNQISNITSQIVENSSMLRQKIMIINKYMKRRKICIALQQKIRKYIEYLHNVKVEENEISKDLI